MANQSIQVEYHQGLGSLEKVLSSVRRSGDFFVHGNVEVPMPKLEIQGLGVISFPVPATQVRQLIEQAERAPYGRGEETILDTSVRKVWQLPPARVRLSGKSWADSFQSILDQVTLGLGCEKATVSAELYKLLVYDQGSFFKAHRDTEKSEGMFGTLVVVLPAEHRGGELVIRHAGRETIVALSGGEPSELGFAAFYADCEHEVRAITEGNRVCLVYNLIQGRGARLKGRTLEAPDYQKQISAVAELLKETLTEPNAPAKLVWLLEHQYSPDGLSLAGLKSADAARAKVLAEAAALADCAAHLGIVHIEESGAAESSYDGGYRYGRRSRWSRHDDEDEIGPQASSNDFEIIDVCDSRQFVNQWRDLQDQPVDFGEVPLEAGELLPASALDDEKPDSQRVTEATGNEGASFERSYHRAALVIWRRARYAEVLLQAGVAATLPYLKECIETCQTKDAAPSARKETVALARRLVKAWTDVPRDLHYRRPAPPEKRDSMLGLLTSLSDLSLMEQFITEVVTRDYDGTENAALVRSARLLGAQQMGTLYAELVRQHTAQRHAHCLNLLRALTSGRETAAKQEWRAGCREIAEAMVSKLEAIGKKEREPAWMDWENPDKTGLVDAALVKKLLNVLGELDAPELRAAAAEKFAARPEVFDPVTILVPALQSVRAWDAATARLWEHSVEFLLRRSNCPPEAPADWRQAVKLSCTCADCRELQKFVLEPVEQSHRFRVRQDRRQHLHQMIEKHDLDMTHVTERKGSPQTLVCTKNRCTYERRCEQYRTDIGTLAALVELASKRGVAASWMKRIETARSLAAEWSPA